MDDINNLADTLDTEGEVFEKNADYLAKYVIALVVLCGHGASELELKVAA